MTPVERLIRAAEPIWEKIYDHPFVRGIQNGDLDKDAFRKYLMQDYRYLRDYCRVYAIGVAKARDLETMRLFADYIPLLLDGEMTIHRSYLDDFGVPEDQMEAAVPLYENRSYTAHMIRAAYEGGPAEVLAAVLPCALTYENIAKKIDEETPDAKHHPFYGTWIDRYLSASYCGRNQNLVDALNRIAADYGEDQLKRLEEIFVAGSEYELGFWEMAWKQVSQK